MHRSIAFLTVAVALVLQATAPSASALGPAEPPVEGRQVMRGPVVSTENGLVLVLDAGSMEARWIALRPADLAIDHALQQVATPESQLEGPGDSGGEWISVMGDLKKTEVRDRFVFTADGIAGSTRAPASMSRLPEELAALARIEAACRALLGTAGHAEPVQHIAEHAHRSALQELQKAKGTQHEELARKLVHALGFLAVGQPAR